ncbi:MAG: hypothetical protein HQL69_09900 [Magnetococcales bacterium]|nr:hypothetical protein [Magnetococcales bacterium]
MPKSSPFSRFRAIIPRYSQGLWDGVDDRNAKIARVGKDLSHVEVINMSIANTDIGFAVYQVQQIHQQKPSPKLYLNKVVR